MAFHTPFARSLRRITPLLRAARPPVGRCATCERPGTWDETPLAYRCRYCGHDPVEHAAPETTPANA